MPVRFVILFIILHSFCILSKAQERCGTVPYMQNLAEKKGVKQNTLQFEEWLQAKILQRSQRLQAQRLEGAPYKIPVVVHIIHNGQGIGTGSNISDAQVLSQIEVLNDDFQRLNADAILTPLDFQPVAAGFDIEFVLAKQDPDGQPTSGINRVNGGQASWSPFDEALNAVSYWPSEDYFNIWVTDLSGNFVGYAQFPYSTSIPGLIGESDDVAETDGIVIDYTAFGVGSSDPDYNLGRTTTHEVGHFFGLRHIWGDTSNCSGTDYVTDTPNQEDETYECDLLTHPVADACTSMKMYQNYMDYTDDVCMNLFTQDQVARMITILETVEIPRRNSLLNSIGLEEPIPGTIDLQINGVSNPGPVTCNETPVLRLNVSNLSEEIITGLKVKITTNSSSSETIDLTGLAIVGSAEISVPSSNTLTIGENVVSVDITRINGATDPEIDNNKIDIPITLIYPACEPFAIYGSMEGETLITFDLPERQQVALTVVDIMGREVARGQFPDMLNQTIPVPTDGVSIGLYIFRLQIGKKYYATKVYLSP